MLSARRLRSPAYDQLSELAYQEDADRLLQQSRESWKRLAEDRLLRFALDGSRLENLPLLSGRVEGTEVHVRAIGTRSIGYRTEARATSGHPMRGAVLVRRKTELDDAFGWMLRRPTFGVWALDAAFSIRATSKSLADAVLDERSVGALHLLAIERSMHAFSYRSGDILVAWRGVERSERLLSEILDLLAYLAVMGAERSPYR